MSRFFRIITISILLPVFHHLSGCTTHYDAHSPDKTVNEAGTHSRRFYASSAPTCLAAQQVLVDQGYTIDHSETTTLRAKKEHQPSFNGYIDMTFHAVCVPDNEDSETVIFVNAIEDRYAFKTGDKTTKNTSRIAKFFSRTTSSDEETLTHIARQTIQVKTFYEPFFNALAQILGVNASQRIPSTIDSNTMRGSRKMTK